MTTLIRPAQRGGDDEERLRSQVAGLEATLGERGAEIVRVKSDLELFRIMTSPPGTGVTPS